MSPLAVLISGGLDSAILLGDALRGGAHAYPLYIRCGLFWETAELSHLRRYLRDLGSSALESLTILDMPVHDLYGAHWSITGKNVPGASSPDEAVFLPGRNVLLLAKGLLWCHLHQVPKLALGSLGSNPFPDASAAFFQGIQDLVNQAMRGQVSVWLPFADMHKKAVMRLGKGLPLRHSFSCIRPDGERHCGRCNKCTERRRAFADAGLSDPTEYV